MNINSLIINPTPAATMAATALALIGLFNFTFITIAYIVLGSVWIVRAAPRALPPHAGAIESFVRLVFWPAVRTHHFSD